MGARLCMIVPFARDEFRKIPVPFLRIGVIRIFGALAVAGFFGVLYGSDSFKARPKDFIESMPEDRRDSWVPLPVELPFPLGYSIGEALLRGECYDE